MSDVSARWQITEPSAARTDAADVPLYVRNVVTALEGKGLVWKGQGTLASRPAATTQGGVYVATDQTPPKMYYSDGSVWDEIGALAAGAVGSTQLADNAITNAKMADDSVGSAEIIADSVGASEIAPGAVTATEIANALKPSQGAGGSTEALRALGTAAGTAAAGSHKTQHQSGGADQILVTMDMLEEAVQNAMWQTGDIKWVGYNVVAGSEPAGWLLGDGRDVSRVTYAALFNKYGTTHGAGDGVNTFGLPNVKGRSPVGIGQGDYSGATMRTIGQKGGEEKHTQTSAEVGVHGHTASSGNDSPDHSHSGTASSAGTHQHQSLYSLLYDNNTGLDSIYVRQGSGVQVPSTGALGGNMVTDSIGAHTHPVSVGGASARHTHAITVNNGGSGTPFNVMHPWIALTPLIKT